MVPWHVANVSAGCFDITIATLPDACQRRRCAQIQRGAAHQFWLVGAPERQFPACRSSPECPSRAIEYLDTTRSARESKATVKRPLLELQPIRNGKNKSNAIAKARPAPERRAVRSGGNVDSAICSRCGPVCHAPAACQWPDSGSVEPSTASRGIG